MDSLILNTQSREKMLKNLDTEMYQEMMASNKPVEMLLKDFPKSLDAIAKWMWVSGNTIKQYMAGKWTEKTDRIVRSYLFELRQAIDWALSSKKE